MVSEMKVTTLGTLGQGQFSLVHFISVKKKKKTNKMLIVTNVKFLFLL
jgi:hypothetical protein